jgi:hypothetical protein
MNDSSEEHPSQAQVWPTRLITYLQIAAFLWFAWQGYSLYKAQKGLQHTVPRASASIQVLSSECKHTMEIEGRKDGKLINRAFQCKDTDMHAN